MSYAEVTSHNAHQSASEAAAPAMPELEHRTAPDAHTLIDVDGAHVQSVPHDFADQPVMTDTQAARLEREAQAALAANRKATRPHQHHRPQAVQQAAQDPVPLATALSTFTLAAIFGFGAYRQSQRPGGFGGWAGVLGWVAGAGALGAANWFGLRVFKNNYRKE